MLLDFGVLGKYYILPPLAETEAKVAVMKRLLAAETELDQLKHGGKA